MNTSKACPKQFLTVSNILGVIYTIMFLITIFPASASQITIFGSVQTFPYWESKLLVLVFSGLAIFLLIMLRRCRIWAVVLTMVWLASNILSAIYVAIFVGFSNLMALLDAFCLYLLITGYLEYRKNSHTEVPPADDSLAISKD